MSTIPRYGVKEAGNAATDIELCAEELRLLGFTTLSSGLNDSELDGLSDAFDQGAVDYENKLGERGIDLKSFDERDTIRVLPEFAPQFWNVAFNDRLHAFLSILLGDYFVLNQVNGLVNRADTGRYSQASYHRDLPYQHFTSSRPLAINALFALDTFTIENGATRVIPASHKVEAFPSDETVRRVERQIEVPRGTFILLDCMLYHSGSTNRSNKDRRAVNHVFTIPIIRQQLHLSSIISEPDRFSEYQRKILGFGLTEFRSYDEWFATRTR